MSELVKKARQAGAMGLDGSPGDNLFGELADRIEKLEAGLEFYADPDSYHAIVVVTDRPCGEFADDFSDPNTQGWDDDHDREMPGKYARALLGERR